MPDFDGIDFFHARPLYQDPYSYDDTTSFSNCNTVTGPFAKFPVPLDGDDPRT